MYPHFSRKEVTLGYFLSPNKDEKTLFMSQTMFLFINLGWECLSQKKDHKLGCGLFIKYFIGIFVELYLFYPDSVHATLSFFKFKRYFIVFDNLIDQTTDMGEVFFLINTIDNESESFG